MHEFAYSPVASCNRYHLLLDYNVYCYSGAAKENLPIFSRFWAILWTRPIFFLLKMVAPDVFFTQENPKDLGFGQIKLEMSIIVQITS